MAKPDPVATADDAALVLARKLLSDARFAALAVIDKATLTPAISRIALAADRGGGLMSLVSSLSAHHASLVANPACAILMGEPGPKGDPLTYPRLMLQAVAGFVARADTAHADLRRQWLTLHPKSKLYVDFVDFGFVRFAVTSAMLNAGFGKAFRLTSGDLA